MRRIIHWTLYLLVILIPLAFTTINSELFEFPKFILLLSATIGITLAWLIHMYLTRDYTLFPSPVSTASRLIHYTAVSILATQTIATLFSIHPYTSFWGYYSRFHGGLLTTICYTIIYFAAVKWLNTESTQKLIKISLKTAIFISLVAILEHFNVSLTCFLMSFLAYLKDGVHIISNTSCWGASTNPFSRSFATLGQPNWLAAYLIPHLFFVLYFDRLRKNKQVFSWMSCLSFATLLLALLVTKSRSGFLAFCLAYLTYWLLIIRTTSFKKVQSIILWFSGAIFTLCLLFGTPLTPALSSLFSRPEVQPAPTVSTNTALETGGTESGDIRKIVWSGAIKLIQEHPILGTGPETFGYTYYWTRPISHNMTSEWEFLYNKAHNEYLNIAAGAGIIGLLAYLAWHVAIFYVSLLKIPKSKKVHDEQNEELRALYPVLGASIISFFVTNFFGFSVIPVYLLMTLITVFPTTLAKMDNPTESKVTTSQYATLTLLAIIFLSWPLKLFYADYLYTLGKVQLDAGQPGVAIPLLERAVAYRTQEDLYISALSESYALMALATGKSTNATTEAQTGQFASHALELAAKTRKDNPYHLNYFKSRAKVYLTLAALDPKYYQPAALELEAARELAPTDPKLAYNLGLIYTRLGRYNDGIIALRQAITLKPNYADPYYALTLLYEQSKQLDQLPPLLTAAKTNLATYSAQLKEKIDKYVK